MTSLFLRPVQFWRTDWFAGLAIVFTVALLHLSTDVIGTLERRFYDFASTATARPPTDHLVVVIAIDDQSLASIGPWPWPRDVHARLIDRLSAAEARVIVHTGLFFEPQRDPGLRYLQQMKAVLGNAADPANAPPVALQAQLTELITEAETALDTDGQLANSFKRAGNVIIPSFVKPGQRPIERLATAAAGVGHLNQVPDVDGTVRRETLLLNDDGKAVPSIALLAAARSLNLTAGDIKRPGAELLQVGPLRIKTDGATRLLPQFYKGRHPQPAFAQDSFDDVLSGKIPASRYTNKIVVIGLTAAGAGPQLAAPGNPALSPAQAVAHITSSILSQQFLVQPRWGMGVTLGVLLLVGAYLVAALPRLSGRVAAVLTALLLMALLGAEFALLSVIGLWLQLVFPATLLVIGYLVLVSKRLLRMPTKAPTPGEDSAETNRMMGLALQGQGQLDLAFERYRRVPIGAAVLGNLHNLAHEFERKQQHSKAQAVYEHMTGRPVDHQDGGSTLPKAPFSPANGPSQAGTRAVLGRYQLERELGQGAMGTVYLGKDPKIGRLVAIKTMALSEEFDGAALLDARERFFREAETAGRLQHPNIVTIFDVGEDHDLAYIAMEFLKGKDLAEFCKGGRLLPVPTVLSIVARVAEALAYAHRQRVVHRDIKPANIMFDPASDTVKVTDFGIARITDASKTRTGLVLGSPSFMSPEQLAGQKVDGRSDLYSLGVMLFQMLAGVLPFRGESLAALMYKITREEAPDIRTIRPELPQSLASLVVVSLSKHPPDRYQEGDQLARDLRALISGCQAVDLEL